MDIFDIRPPSNFFGDYHHFFFQANGAHLALDLFHNRSNQRPLGHIQKKNWITQDFVPQVSLQAKLAFLYKASTLTVTLEIRLENCCYQ